MDFETLEYRRPSSCGEGEILSRAWLPDAPRAVIQIAHGMQEHAGRYAHFAQRLASEGWAVCANDHIGHGESSLGHPGTFSLSPGGFSFLMRDMHTLTEDMAARYPGLPRILLGHSMGSIAAALCAAHFDDADILILLGTPAPVPGLWLGIRLADAYAKRHGPTAVSPLFTKLESLWMGGRSGDPAARFSFMSRDREEVRRAVEDPLFGHPFSASAYGELFRGLQAFGSRRWAAAVRELPVLIMAGGADPFGRKGRGPRHYARALRAAGRRDVTLKIFPGARHELLHELDREEAEDAIIAYIREKLAALQKNGGAA